MSSLPPVSRIICALLGIFAFAAPVSAQTPEPAPQPTPVVDVIAAGEEDWLTNNRGTWTTYSATVIDKWTTQRAAYLEFDDALRFRQEDQQLTAGMYFPLGRRFEGLTEVSSSTGNVLPQYSVLGQAIYSSGAGWDEQLGYRHTQYTTATVNSGTLTVERYWKSFRASYALTGASLAGTGFEFTHAFALDYYYGRQNSSMGLRYATGKDIEPIAPGRLLVSPVNGWDVTGTHWWNDRFGTTYDVSDLVLGTLYTKWGIRLGLRARL